MRLQKKCKTVAGGSMSMTFLARAETYTNLMLEREMRGPGDKEGALDRLAARYGVARNTFERIRTGKAKDVTGTIFARIRAGYLDICAEQIGKLQTELQREKAAACDEALLDYMGQIQDLAARISAERADLRTQNKTQTRG